MVRGSFSLNIVEMVVLECIIHHFIETIFASLCCYVTIICPMNVGIVGLMLFLEAKQKI